MAERKATRARNSAVPALLILGLLVMAPPGQAQEIRGRLVEKETAQPIVAGSVMLLDTTFAVLVGTTSNQAGAFALQTPGPGSYYILAEALGYEPAIDGILEMGPGGSITIAMVLEPKPVQLDSIKVAVERAMVYQNLQKQGFYDRQTTGFGHFITPEQIRRRNPRYFSDLFRTSPGVVLQGGGALGGTTVHFSNASIRGATCEPLIYVEGILVDQNMGGLEGAVDINQIAAVEVYTRASSVPLQWGGTMAGCGVLLIWTR